ncbi:hypothetical protein NMY22_g6475 [Coprinellus aureogranulatus]|nr:hypothetical protein NMY22_g6475 [Coprinellus aureogranulatus]
MPDIYPALYDLKEQVTIEVAGYEPATAGETVVISGLEKSSGVSFDNFTPGLNMLLMLARAGYQGWLYSVKTTKGKEIENVREVDLAPYVEDRKESRK